jgi:hypothetical protein
MFGDVGGTLKKIVHDYANFNWIMKGTDTFACEGTSHGEHEGGFSVQRRQHRHGRDRADDVRDRRSNRPAARLAGIAATTGLNRLSPCGISAGSGESAVACAQAGNKTRRVAGFLRERQDSNPRPPA